MITLALLQNNCFIYYDLTLGVLNTVNNCGIEVVPEVLRAMLYLRMCFDRAAAVGLRAERLQQHREYVASFLEERDGARVVQGGPMLDEAETGYRGSFMVIDAQSVTDALAFHDGDPFTQAGLFDTVHLVPWERHIGNDGTAPYVP